MIVEYYLTAYPAVYGQFPQAIPQQIAAVPAQREGKRSPSLKKNTHSYTYTQILSIYSTSIN